MQEFERLGDERGRPKSVWVETISWRVTALRARFRVVRMTGKVTAHFISVARDRSRPLCKPAAEAKAFLLCRLQVQALENTAGRVQQNDIRLGLLHILRIERDQAVADLHCFERLSGDAGAFAAQAVGERIRVRLHDVPLDVFASRFGLMPLEKAINMPTDKYGESALYRYALRGIVRVEQIEDAEAVSVQLSD
jgi:hypothetical protein